MEAIGKKALAEVIRALEIGGRDPDATAESLWPAFKVAVAGALEEIEEEGAEGLRVLTEWAAGRKAEELEG